MSNGAWCEFLVSFFANLLSDILVGALLGTVLAWWIGKKLAVFEGTEQRKVQKRAELSKAVQYLELLKDETQVLYDTLPGFISKFGEKKHGKEIRIPTPFWDILQPSGELPRLLDPHLLAALALLYDHLAYAKRAKDLVIDSWLVPQRNTVPGMNLKQETFVDMTLCGLKAANKLMRADEFEGNLPGKLCLYIENLKREIQAL